MDRAERLGHGSIVSLLLKFSAPAIVAMVAQALYNIVDRVFVGQALGTLGIAGVTLAFPFMLVLMAFGMLIGYGSAALISIRLGERRREDAERVLGHAVVLLLLASLGLTICGLVFLDPLLRLMGASAASQPIARQYLQIIVAGSCFQILGFGLNATIRGEGNLRIAMCTVLIGALLNTLLDALFLFGFGWGVRGAALATILSQVVSTTWVWGYFMSGRSLLRLHWKNLRLRGAICRSIVVTGSPMFAMQLANSVMNTILLNQLRVYGGDLAISVMGIVHAVSFCIAMPVFGLNQGSQPIIGYNYGARNYDRVLRTLQWAVLFATVICVAGFVLAMFAPAHVIVLFSHRQQGDPELMAMGSHAIRICLAMYPIIGFQIVSSSYFLAVGKPKQALILGLSRQVLFLIPAVVLLPRVFGLDGVWYAYPTADLCASVLTAVWLGLELRELRRQREAVGGGGGGALPTAGWSQQDV